ncbi:hypothetical protein [Pseudomonas sp. F8002]|uniref:hypothetical protein n=1 Tax=Pseudomonas sp. F8002 TaxID=2738822 RepID=UPI00159F8BE5|nr:hypothetical protein [Pseudomonas sp. F8002]NWB51882.1 hypothetical protein [Pseudomonas sp. F8002]
MSQPNEPNITFEKEISHEHNIVKVRYFKDKHPIKSYAFDTSLGKQCAGLQLIIKDLEIVLATLKLTLTLPLMEPSTNPNIDYFQFTTSNPDQLILTSLINSSIITYAKYFTQGKGLAPFINSEKIKSELSSDAYILHEKIIDLRHNFIAHGGVNDFELAKTVILIDLTHSHSLTYVHHVHHSVMPLVNNIEAFIDLTESFLRIIKSMLQKRSKALWETEINKIPIGLHISKAGDHVTFSNKS